MIQNFRRWLETPFRQRAYWTWLLFPLFFPISLFVAVVAALRRNMFFSFFRKNDFPFPIVCIGNIAMGGTGKSPIVRALAKFYLKRDFRVAILSRGFGNSHRAIVSSLNPSQQNLLNDENNEHFSLLNQFSNFILLQGADRVENLEFLKNQWRGHDNCIAFLDDGLQNLKTPRSQDICVWDGPSLFKAPTCTFPLGPYREGWFFNFDKLVHHFFPIITHTENCLEVAQPRFPEVCAFLKEKFKSHPPERGPWFTIQRQNYQIFEPTYSDPFVKIEQQKFCDLVNENSTALVLGVARPENICSHLHDIGILNFETFEFSDHSASIEDVKAIANQYKTILTTAKDFYRWRNQKSLSFFRANRWLILGVEVEFFQRDGKTVDRASMDKVFLWRK